MKLKINTVSGYQPGQVITIPTDSVGIPTDKFWRKRLKDSKIDNCVEIVKSKNKGDK